MKLFKIGRRGGPTSELAAATDTQPRSNGRTTPRAEAARNNPNWTEVDDLVRRGRFFVSASDDGVYSSYDGLVWNHADRIEYAYHAALFFTVEGGNVRLLERHPHTWSQIIGSQAGAR